MSFYGLFCTPLMTHPLFLQGVQLVQREFILQIKASQASVRIWDRDN